MIAPKVVARNVIPRNLNHSYFCIFENFFLGGGGGHEGHEHNVSVALKV